VIYFDMAGVVDKEKGNWFVNGNNVAVSASEGLTLVYDPESETLVSAVTADGVYYFRRGGIIPALLSEEVVGTWYCYEVERDGKTIEGKEDDFVFKFNEDSTAQLYLRWGENYEKAETYWSLSGSTVRVVNEEDPDSVIEFVYNKENDSLTAVITGDGTYHLRRGGKITEFITYDESVNEADCFVGGTVSVKIGASDGKAVTNVLTECDGNAMTCALRRDGDDMYLDVTFKEAGNHSVKISADGYAPAVIYFDVNGEKPTKRLLGDVNGDGVYTADDASLILAYYAYLSGFGDTADGTPMTLEQWLYSSNKYDPDKIRGISNNTGDTNCNGRFDPDDASNLLGYYAYASGFTKENEREMMTFVEWLLDKKLITEEQAKALD